MVTTVTQFILKHFYRKEFSIVNNTLAYTKCNFTENFLQTKP